MPQRIDVPGMGVVEFPDGMSDKDIVAAIKRNMTAQQPAQPQDQGPSTVSDVAMSGASGLAKGVINLAGLPGDVQNLLRAGLRAAGVSVPDNLPMPNIALMGLPVPAPSSSDIQGKVEDMTGKFHEPQTTAGQYAQTLGEFAPAAIGGEAGLVKKAAQVALPALASETAGQVAQNVSPALEPYARAAGAVVGGLAPAGLAKAVTPLDIPMERKAALGVLKKEGVDVTAGQATGRKSVQYAESEIGGGAAANKLDKQQSQFTKAVLSRIGVNADRATPDVIDKAYKQIGQKFDKLAKSNNVTVGNKLSSDLTSIADEYHALGGTAPVVAGTVDALKAIQGQMSGKTYQAVASRLARQARTTKDPELKFALQDIRSALDDAFERTLAAKGQTDALNQLKEARRQYRDFVTIERAATGAGADTAMGVISPLRLRTAVASMGRREYARGKRDLGELARAGTAIMSPLPQSGTAPRAAARAIPTILGASFGAGAGGDPISTLAGATLGSAAPFIAGRALMSKPVQSYLQNQALSGVQSPQLSRIPLNALLSRQ